jgi:tetratricopeptide (TPR) repeat protein
VKSLVSVRMALAGAITVGLVVAGCSRSAQTYLDRGDQALARGDVAAAVLDYRNAVQQDAMLGSARKKLAEAYLIQGNVVEALREYVRAADLSPTDVSLQVKVGSLLLLAGRPEEARGRADKALAIDSKNVDALVLRANALGGLTDLDGALKQIQEAVSLDPRAALQSNLGAIQAARGNLPEAEAAFRKAVSIDPTSAAAQVALGQFLWAAGRAAEAEVAFKAALARDAFNVQANRSLAAFYIQSGRTAEAEAYFVKVVAKANSAQAALALADYYRGTNRSADALRVLEKLSTDPLHWALARARIADVQHAAGRAQDAFRTVDEVIMRQPALAPARVVRGRLLLADSRIDEALRDATEAVKADPASVEGHFLLGSVHEAKRDLDAAASSYREVLRLNPRASVAQVRLSMIEMQRNSLPAASQLAEQAAAAQPDNLAARLVLARSLLARGDIDRSAAVTQTLVRQAPEAPVVQNQVGMLALARGDLSAARVAFEQALAGNPGLVEPLAALVSMDLTARQPAAARARLKQRLQRTPRSSPVLAIAGRTWALTGDLSKGEEFLRRAIEADASNLDAYSQLAQVYLAQKKLDEAVVEFDRASVRQPRAIGPPTMAAMILQAQGREAEARARYERIVGADPRAAVAANNLAWAYATEGQQLDRALQLAQAAKAEIPDHPQINDTLGFVYLKKELPALAIAPLKLAVDKEPADPSFHYHLGLAYARCGDKALARQSLERALRLKADFGGADDARGVLKTLD